MTFSQLTIGYMVPMGLVPNPIPTETPHQSSRLLLLSFGQVYLLHSQPRVSSHSTQSSPLPHEESNCLHAALISQSPPPGLSSPCHQAEFTHSQACSLRVWPERCSAQLNNGFDRSRLKSGLSNKRMQDFFCQADNLPTQKQGFFSSLLRCPPPLVQAPPLFTCATDHTQTRSRMSLSFLKYARICICGMNTSRAPKASHVLVITPNISPLLSLHTYPFSVLVFSHMYIKSALKILNIWEKCQNILQTARK